MKTYNLNRIFLIKLLTLNLISFIVTFAICILLISVTNKFLGLNIASLFLLLLGLFLAFIVYPWSIKHCSENIEIQIEKNQISIIGESFLINEVEKLNLNYRFLRFPQLKLYLKDKSEKNFIIDKYRKDYFDLESMLK